MSDLLRVENGFYRYPHATNWTLTNVQFSWSGKGVLAILGPNGAGKTTLLRATLGFLPWSQGQSYFAGRTISSYRPQELWRAIGYVAQAKPQGFAAMTLREMVVLGRSAHLPLFAQPGKADWAKVDAALSEVGIAHLAHRYTNEVSGGQLQLALIARALVTEPQILVLDRPESNLDFKNQRVVLQVIEKMAEKGLGCLINTHFPAHAIELADHALLVPRAQPPIFGAAKNLLTEENLSKLFDLPIKIIDWSDPTHTQKATAVFSLRNK